MRRSVFRSDSLWRRPAPCGGLATPLLSISIEARSISTPPWSTLVRMAISLLNRCGSKTAAISLVARITRLALPSAIWTAALRQALQEDPGGASPDLRTRFRLALALFWRQSGPLHEPARLPLRSVRCLPNQITAAMPEGGSKLVSPRLLRGLVAPESVRIFRQRAFAMAAMP